MSDSDSKDFGSLRARGLDGLLKESEEILRGAVEEHDPVSVFAMFSGGLDSLVATSVAAEVLAGDLSGVVHLNTGIGVPETREYVRETCERFGWDLVEKEPPDKTYREMVLENGFPGPGAHRFAVSWLKERALREVVREAKGGRFDRVLLVTGVRRLESKRRMGSVERVDRDGAKVWAAPLFSWSKVDTRRFAADRGLPVNPVVDLLHMSGECLCGAFATEGEFEELKVWYPEVADRIRALEQEVDEVAEERGIPEECRRWGLRRGAPEASLDEFSMLCVGCEGKADGGGS